MTKDSGRTEFSFVCSLPSPELTARRAEIQGFIEEATSVVSRPDGVLFAFANTVETAHALVDFILFEQQCCSSITYELRSEPRHSHFTLQLRAPADQVLELQKIYSNGDKPQQRLDGTTAKNRLVPASGILHRLCNMAGPVGAVICAVICLGVPIVSASLGVFGMNILQQDRLLIPLELLCCAAFLWAIEQGRRVHHESSALWLALIAAGTFVGSMFAPRALSGVCVVGGCAVLGASIVLNRRSLKRCSCD
jgi:MerC mercury resistance protein